MFPYANELTPFETDRPRELLQTAGILFAIVYPVLQFIINEDILLI